MAACQEPGPHHPDWPHCAAQLKQFLQRWYGESGASGMSHRVCAMARQTIVGNCKARVNCKGSVFRQLASRWANDRPAGQLSRSQWVWLWDIPEVLVWTAWNPQGKQRPPTPCVSPSVPPTRASTAKLPRQLITNEPMYLQLFQKSALFCQHYFSRVLTET